MKKFMSLMIILCLLCTALPLRSYAVETEENNEAAQTLEALGIMEGSGGSLVLDKVLTRAEFVTMLTRILGAEYENIKVYFEDVDENHWAVSSIATACEMGIVQGIDERIFAPDDPVTYEEAVKMLVAALGYEIQAIKKGGYPSGYIAVAQTIDLLDDVSGSTGTILRREAAAQLIYNALDAEIVLETGFKSNGEIDASTQKGATLLLEKMKIRKGEGIVTADELTSLSVQGGLSEGQVEIGGCIFKAGRTGAEKYLGYNVTYYADASDNDEVQELLYIRVNDNKNNVVTVRTEDIDLENTTLQSFAYFDEDEDKRKMEISLIADLLYNGVSTGGFTMADLKPKSGYVTLIDNNLDKKADVLLVYDFETIIAGSVSFDGFRAYHYKDYTKFVELDPGDEEYRCTIYENGEEKQFISVKEGSVLLVGTSKNTVGDKRITVLLSNNSFIGEISAIGDSSVVINDTEYDVEDSIKSALIPYLGQETLVYIDALGKIAGIDDEKKAGFSYGYLIKHASEGSISGKIIFKILTQENEVALLYGAKKISVDGATAVAAGSAAVAVDTAAPTDTIGEGQLIRYKLNSKNEITAIDTASSDKYGEADALSRDITKGKNTDYIRRYMGSFFGRKLTEDGKTLYLPDFSADEKTIVFVVPEDAYADDDMQYAVVNKDYFRRAGYYDVMEVYDLSDTRCARVCLLQQVPKSEAYIPDSSLLTLIESIRVTNNTFGEETYKLIVWQAGKKISLLTEDKTVLINPDTGNLYKSGDLVRYATNTDGDISRIQAIMVDAAGSENQPFGMCAVGSNSNNFYASVAAFYGYLTKKDGNQILMDTVPGDDTAGIEFPAILQDSTKYVLYDAAAKEAVNCTEDTLLEHTYSHNSNSRVVVSSSDGNTNVVVIYKFD